MENAKRTKGKIKPAKKIIWVNGFNFDELEIDRAIKTAEASIKRHKAGHRNVSR